jgi:Uma2 family endonuclease
MAALRAHPPSTPSPMAPWAEIAPDAPYPTTVDELHALPDDGWTYELLNGVLVRMPLSSGGASNVGSRLLIRLGAYVEDNDLGLVTGEQGGYRLDPAHPLDTEVAPDVAFVRAGRAPSPTSPEFYGRAWLLAPDLAVEVASENQFAPGMETKAQLYLRFGTRLVWVIWPRYKRVDVWRPGDETPTPLGVEDALDGEGVVPGFTCQIARLFP